MTRTTTRPDGVGGFVRDPFQGNIIPSGPVFPSGRKVLEHIPNPDLLGVESELGVEGL